MRSFFYNPPRLLKNLYPNTFWETRCSKVVLTFDDGPTKANTEKILKKLEQHNISALFFCVGENLERNTDLAKLILENGHTIGSHNWKHERIMYSSSKKFIEGINGFNRKIGELLDIQIKYFRPPYGRILPHHTKVLSELKVNNVMWSLLTYDYQSDLNKVKFAIDNYLQNNSIVVLHDSQKTTSIIEDSIDYLVESVKRNGFQFGNPEECLK